MIQSDSNGDFLSEQNVMNPPGAEVVISRTPNSSPETDEDDCSPHYIFLDENGNFSPHRHVLLMALEFPDVLVGWEVTAVLYGELAS